MCLYLPTLHNENILNTSKIKISYEIGLSFFANGGAMIITLVYSCNQEILINVFNRLVHLETILTNEFNHSFQVQELLSAKCHQIMAITIHIIINIVLLISELIRYNAHQFFYVVRLALPGFFIGSMIIQYTLIIIFMKNKFRYLNELLLSSENPIKQLQVDSSVNNIRASLENKLLNDFKIIRKAQRVLYEVSWDLIEFYSLPVLLAIAIAFIQLVYHCYFFVSPLLKTSEFPPPVIIINDIMWIMKDVFPIIVLTTTISQFIIEMQRTSQIIYKIMATSALQMGIKYEFEQFSVELLHRDIFFNACGLFSLDNSLLKSVKNFYYVNKLCSLIANPVEDNRLNSIFIIVSSVSHQDSFEDFIIMRNAHRELCEISFSFVNIMSFPVLLAISAVSIDLVYGSFNFVSLYTFPETFAQTLNFIDGTAWLIMDISPIVVLTISITQIIAEMKRTSKIIYKNIEKLGQREMRYEVWMLY
ncbi:hypothetical protein PV327_001644 [Microctonus hyperodae]|uniref:Gustatory receptor n=1 Tax=Microctonus hyperodae TaxID=165561 RepID=A0AA39FE10_MICHY|nr:hypothetical protein PV327_001644 [Microctonus hyperodae]